MQLKLPFRLTRGVTVLIVIVVVHVILAALFIGMRVRVEVPDLGPVFATLLEDSPDAAHEPAHPRRTPPPASEVPLAPAAP
jgi:hypothetical protein